MTAEELNTLLEDVKLELNITWSDTNTDKRILGYIKRGMYKLNDVAGLKNSSEKVDFLEENSARQLLFDYCRYANSNALEVFEENFQSELLSLHLDYQAPNYKEVDDEDTE